VIQQLNQTKPVTSIEVFKSQRLLQLKHQDEVIQSYPIRLGFNPIGHKFNLKVMAKHLNRA
jgi:hypothetical protein